MLNVETFLRRARKGALILMILVAAETVYYTWDSFRQAWRFSFGEPERWHTHWRVDDGTVIETGARIGYFSIWAVVILLSVAAFLAGLHLLNRCRKGFFFDEGTAQAVRLLGGVLAIAMIVDQMFQSADAWLLTRFNAGGPEPIAWFYDPSDIKTFSMAVILFLFGSVMRKAMDVEQENRGFV